MIISLDTNSTGEHQIFCLIKIFSFSDFFINLLFDKIHAHYQGKKLLTPLNLFITTFIAIISTYLMVFGQEKTLTMITSEYLFILGLIAITFALLFFKFKLKGYELIDFNKKNAFSLQSTIVFFLIFQVVDYISEDGFIGMISQWFLYWIMGLIALLLMQTINYYKNYKVLQTNN